MANLSGVTELFRAHSGAMVLYARQWLDRENAQDVVQEAFVALLSQRREPDDPKAWMYRVVHNAAMDRGRRAARERKHYQIARRQMAGKTEELFESRSGAALDARVAEAALAGLPPELREIIVLRVWGGLSIQQAAAVSGSSAGTVHRRYHEGLRQLRAILEKPCPMKP